MITEMNKKNFLEDKIKAIIKEMLNLNGKDITKNDDLRGLGLDSLNAVGLIVELESVFNIEFFDEELLFDNFSNIGRIVEKVESKFAENNE